MIDIQRYFVSIQKSNAHFQVDSNPDGADLERIANITGLSKRVTQVWFQNHIEQYQYTDRNEQIVLNSVYRTLEHVRRSIKVVGKVATVLWTVLVHPKVLVVLVKKAKLVVMACFRAQSQQG
ncbi:homeobox domain protein [Dictyocaulus viviparus]|uniref:Homeobox domain protein n=1 Tax=Dictyocaulus viviparus TaxID=29172 RepID=A0A0D8X6V8_DICVI|nr:homeobox domain protein [Dictyocaulus viviparus]